MATRERKIGVAGRKISRWRSCAGHQLGTRATFDLLASTQPYLIAIEEFHRIEFSETLPPIPRIRLPLTPETEPRAIVPAGMTVKPPIFTSLTTTKFSRSPTRAWAEDTLSESRRLIVVPSGMTNVAGTALLSSAEIQGTRKLRAGCKPVFCGDTRRTWNAAFPGGRSL